MVQLVSIYVLESSLELYIHDISRVEVLYNCVNAADLGRVSDLMQMAVFLFD